MTRLLVLIIVFFSLPVQAYDWQPQPEKAALMIVFAHADDEGIFFGGAITYYAAVRKLPVVAVCLTHSGTGTRANELRCAIWKYGLRNEPVFAGLGDCCYSKTLECCWTCWGGKDRAVGYLTELIRRYQPDVLLGHDFDGEYGHPNHMGAGIAVSEAYNAAGNPQKYPGQLTSLSTWQPKKCYIHLYQQNQHYHDWDMVCPELGGKTPRQVTNEGLTCHVSQGPRYVDYGQYDARRWGLFGTTVGPDVVAKNNFFENVDISIYQDVTVQEGSVTGEHFQAYKPAFISKVDRIYNLTGNTITCPRRPGIYITRPDNNGPLKKTIFIK